MTPIYLDNNATTRLDPDVLAAMLPFLTDQFANPSSSHGFGDSAALAVQQARRQVRTLLGAAFDQEILFTSGGTESDNTAILSALEAQPMRRKIVISSVEHPAVLALCDHLHRTRGVVVSRIPVDRQGRLDRDAYRQALGPGVAVVSIMWANNETGAIFPVAELAEEAHGCGALFHTDAVQVVGKLPVDLHGTKIDMLSLSGHKLHGPKGIGALYVRKGVQLSPLLHGGKQERGRRAGTENVPGIVGLGHAAFLAAGRLAGEQTEVRALRDRLEQGVLRAIPGSFVVGEYAARLANTACIAFDRAEAEPILMALSQAGIAASSGSACASGSMDPSHVLKAMSVPYTALHGAIRFSLSHDNTAEEVERVLALLPAIVARAREVSPFADIQPVAMAAE
jgi:cysteine desulfurase